MTQSQGKLPGLFVTGTDTHVGKTRVVCWLARLLREQGIQVGVCKPAVSGATPIDGGWIWEDLERLLAEVGDLFPAERICPFRWFSALAPPVAAEYDRLLHDEGHIPYARGVVSLPEYRQALDEWEGTCECLITEGVGGLLCPLTQDETAADLAVQWGRPVLVVSRLGLGTLSHTLMTVECARRRGLEVIGVLLNQTIPGAAGPAEESNPVQLRRRLDLPVWGPIRYQVQNEIPPEIRDVDWQKYL